MITKLIGCTALAAFCVLCLRQLFRSDAKRLDATGATVALMKHIHSTVSLYRMPLHEIFDGYGECDADMRVILTAGKATLLGGGDRAAVSALIGEAEAACYFEFIRTIGSGDVGAARKYIDELEALYAKRVSTKGERRRLVRDVFISVTLMAIILLI